MTSTKQQIRVVAFDCDGVMFDTVKANTAYYNQILTRFGKPGLNPEQFAYAHMHTADKALEYLFPDSDEFEAANAYRKSMSYMPFIKAMEINPDLKHVLKTIRPIVRTAVATNRADTMPRVLEEFGLDGDFDLVVTANDVKHPKPFPDPLLKIIRHFNILPEQMLFIGDSEVDETAATAAGTPFAAFQNPSLSADCHISSLTEICGILNHASDII